MYCEKANEAASKAAEAKRKGDLTSALNAHSDAARVFREAAIIAREGDGAFQWRRHLSNMLLVLSLILTISFCSFLVQFAAVVESGSSKVGPCAQAISQAASRGLTEKCILGYRRCYHYLFFITKRTTQGNCERSVGYPKRS